MQTILQNKQVKTRKPHKCYGCQKEFPPQSQMRLITAIGDDKPQVTYYCQHCDNYSENWTIVQLTLGDWRFFINWWSYDSIVFHFLCFKLWIQWHYIRS